MLQLPSKSEAYQQIYQHTWFQEHLGKHFKTTINNQLASFYCIPPLL